MGYGAVIIVIGTIIVSGLLLISMGSAASDADVALNDYHYNELARDAALTGLQLTVRKLAADKNPWVSGTAYSSDNTYYKSGSFRITVKAHGGDTVDVQARGFNGNVRKVIYARYVREYADGGIPPSFRNVITTNSYLQLNGNVSIRAINSSLNASIHTNDNLETNGNAFTVEGYGSYTGSAFTNQEDNFIPNIDYNGADPNVFWADSVHIPPIDLDGLRTDALQSGAIIDTGDGSPFNIDGDVTSTIDFASSGGWPWLGSYPYNCPSGSCGTEDRPFILVVEGPLNFFNRVEFRGYGVVIAAGDIYIDPQGNEGGVAGEFTMDDETMLLLATTGKMLISGNAKIADGPNYTSCDPDFTGGATLYAWQEIRFQGTPCVVGGLVTKEAYFEGGGSPEITYASPSEVVTDPGFEFVVPIGPVLVSYNEW